MTKKVSSCFRRSQEKNWFHAKQFIADERIRQSAISKNDKRILASAADEPIAKEPVYHKSCYRKYTLPLYNSQREKRHNISATEVSFEPVKDYLLQLYEEPDIIEYSVLTDIVESELVQHEFTDETIIQSVKKNLKRKIKQILTGFNFLNIRGKVIVYPTKNVIEKLYIVEIELNLLKLSTDVNKIVFQAASIIRNEI